MLVSWSSCSSDAPSASARPCGVKAGTVCWQPCRVPLRSLRTQPSTSPLRDTREKCKWMKWPSGTDVIGELPNIVSTWTVQELSIASPWQRRHGYFTVVLKTFSITLSSTLLPWLFQKPSNQHHLHPLSLPLLQLDNLAKSRSWQALLAALRPLQHATGRSCIEAKRPGPARSWSLANSSLFPSAF